MGPTKTKQFAGRYVYSCGVTRDKACLFNSGMQLISKTMNRKGMHSIHLPERFVYFGCSYSSTFFFFFFINKPMTAILINWQSQVLYNLCETNTTIIRNSKYLHMYLYYGTLSDREFEIL